MTDLKRLDCSFAPLPPQNSRLRSSVALRRRRPPAWPVAATALGVVVAAASAAAGVIALDRHHRQNAALGDLGSRQAASPAEKQALFLARSTLLALQHANVTGDYRVLWQLSAPAFQSANPPQRLNEIFAEYRLRRMDLSIAALSQPEWTLPPRVGSDGQLHLKGYFPVNGRRLEFDLAYVAHDGIRRMCAISVSVRADGVRPAVVPAAI